MKRAEVVTRFNGSHVGKPIRGARDALQARRSGVHDDSKEDTKIENKTKILVIDDNPDLLLLASLVLGGAGYEVLEASTGKEGLEKARTHHPDGVLLDVVLPDISGIDAVRQIKEDRDLKHMFVILASGVRTSSEYQTNGLNMGADGYITKPIANAELVARIQSMVRIRKAEEALRESETRYRRLFETAQDGILILDADTGEIDDVNPFLIDMLGYTHADFQGKKLWEIGAFKDITASKKMFATLQRKGYIRYEDLPLKTKDGREIAVEFVSNVYQANRHKVIQCNVRDITDRKLAEAEVGKAHDEMERRVEERTAQLSESNELLRQKAAERTIIEKQLEESQERLRYLSAHLRRVREEERTSLSRELHDELGQVLTGIKMDVAWIGRRTQKDGAAILDKVDSLLTLIDDAILSVQRISMSLRPPALDDFGLQEAVKQAAEDFTKRTNIAVEITSKPRSIPLAKEISTEAFRIFQEALTNIVRHSGARGVAVSLRNTGGRFAMEITDDGRGITKAQISDLKSIGLTGMRERAFAIGGALTIMGMRGKGTTIALTVPLSGGKAKPDTVKRRSRKQPEEG